MEERSSPRLVTQRQFEIEPARPPSSPASSTISSPVAFPVSPPKSEPANQTPPALPAVSTPVGPSNRGLLDRQLRWYRERAKFEANRPAEEASR